MECAVGFEKLRTIKNPINGKKFFDDEVHIKDAKIANMPIYYIAKPDLDLDGIREIIVYLSEDSKASKGLFCKSKHLCPHFVIQDRNTNPEKPQLRYFSLIGVSYANGIGLSTDEKVGCYKSLRVYKSGNVNNFDVYQYDKKDDRYYNVSGKR